MATRLMLSLKRAADAPTDAWSLSTMGDFGRGRPTDGSLHFASQTFDASHQIPEAFVASNGENIELESMPELPQDYVSR